MLDTIPKALFCRSCSARAHNQTSKCGKEPRSSNRKFYFLSHPMAPSKPLNTALLYMASVYTHTTSFLNRQAFTHRETFTHNKLLHTEKLLHTTSFYTEKLFLIHSKLSHSKRLHTEHLHTVLLRMASV